MTLKELTELAQVYGGDLSRWPSEDAAAAAALLKRSAEAQQALAEAAALDQAVCPGDAGEAPEGLLDKIVKAVD